MKPKVLTIPRRPCPFCGCYETEIKRQQHLGEWWWIVCMQCGARGPRMDSRNYAIERWNMRQVPNLRSIRTGPPLLP